MAVKKTKKSVLTLPYHKKIFLFNPRPGGLLCVIDYQQIRTFYPSESVIKMRSVKKYYERVVMLVILYF